MQYTSSKLIIRHGIAMRWEGDDNSGAWIAAFHFAGPDIVAQGATVEAALQNFLVAVHLYQDDNAMRIRK